MLKSITSILLFEINVNTGYTCVYTYVYKIVYFNICTGHHYKWNELRFLLLKLQRGGVVSCNPSIPGSNAAKEKQFWFGFQVKSIVIGFILADE